MSGRGRSGFSGRTFTVGIGYGYACPGDLGIQVAGRGTEQAPDGCTARCWASCRASLKGLAFTAPAPSGARIEIVPVFAAWAFI
jgi:hypothetical protein